MDGTMRFMNLLAAVDEDVKKDIEFNKAQSKGIEKMKREDVYRAGAQRGMRTVLTMLKMHGVIDAEQIKY